MSLLFAALVAGCAAPTNNPALDEAGAAVERARSAPRVRALAATELDRAEVALEQARAAARAGAPPDQVEHLAYVVSQRAALAEARAAEWIARSEVGQLQRALARGRQERERPARAPVRGDQKRRALGQVRLDQDRQAPASSAQPDQQTTAPLEGDQHTRASLEPDQPKRTPVREIQPTRARLDQDGRERAWAPRDRHSGAPLGEEAREPAPVQGDRLARAPLEEEWQPASPREHAQPGAPLGQDGRQPAAVQGDRPARAPLEDGREPAPVQEDPPAGSPLGVDARERTSVHKYRQARAPLEQDQQERGSVQDGRQPRAPLEQDPREDASENEQTRTAEPDDGAAILLGTVPQDITLRLAQLPFEGAEPTDDAIEQLTALAERLQREPGRRISIEVDFELPDPEARTVMERRVEVVRAILVRRDIEPARLIVRAANGPVEPRATPSSVEPLDRAP